MSVESDIRELEFIGLCHTDAHVLANILNDLDPLDVHC